MAGGPGMQAHRHDGTHGERWRRRAWAASVGFLGLLLFTWPFVRTPPVGLGPTYAHLLGAWVAVVAALHAMARTIGGGRGGKGSGGA